VIIWETLTVLDEGWLAKLVVIAVVAFLYASVGHGGATGYIAVMSLWGIAAIKVATTALVLNSCVSAIAFVGYWRAGHFSWGKAWPFLLLSSPAAYWGAQLHLDKSHLAIIMGLTILLAALRFLFISFDTQENVSEISNLRVPHFGIAAFSGALLGLLAGIVGIGGGVFLSPLLVLNRWATTKESSCIAALFIFVNSLAGLGGRFVNGQLSELSGYGIELWGCLLVAVPCALAGSYLGAHKFASRVLQRLLALVLLVAAIKLLLGHS
jgi:uncharacterized membrane protein YfcA